MHACTDTAAEPTSRAHRTRPWSRATTPEEASRLCGETFSPHGIKTLGPSKAFAYRQRVARTGPITVGDLAYATDVRLDFDETRTGYHITIPVAGWLEARHQGAELTASSDLASICRPQGEKSIIRWPGGSRILAVKIDQAAVDDALERLLGRRPDSPVPVGPTIPLQDPEARSWMHMLTALGQLDEACTPAWRSLVSDPLIDGLIHGFLLLADHPYRDVLRAPVPPSRPAVVRLAIEAIEAGPDLPLTTSTLAAHCNVSVRTLQAGFQHHLGVSPMAYLRDERLRRARLELESADPSSTTVAEIAHRWGFSHLGRFGAAYKARYGETPARALRSA